MKTKVNIGFGLIFLMLISISIFSIINTIILKNIFEELETNILPAEQTMAKMKYESIEIQHWVQAYIIRGNIKIDRKTIKNWLAQRYIELKNNAKLHLKHEQNNGNSTLKAEFIEKLCDQLTKISTQIIELKDKGTDNAKLLEKLKIELKPVFYPLRRILQIQQDERLLDFSQAKSATYNQHKTAIVTITIISIISLFLALIIRFFVAAKFIKNDAALRKSEERARQIIQTMPGGLFTVDKNCCITSWNHGAEQMTGLRAEDVFGKHCSEALNYKDCGQKCAIFDQSISKPIFSKQSTIQVNGTKHILLKNIDVLTDAKGEIIGGLESFIDITETLETQQKLQESEKQFNELVEQVPNIAIQGYDADGTVFFWNSANEKIYGWSKKEALGKNLVDLIIPKEMQEFVQNAIKSGAQTGEMIPASELRLMRKDRSLVDVFSSHAVIKRQNNKALMFCFDIDITERKKAEEALSKSEERFKELANLLPQPIWETDLKGNFIYTNKSGYETMGYTQKDLEGNISFINLIAPEDRERIALNFGKVIKGIYIENREYTCVTKVGRKFPVIIYSVPIIKDGKPVGIRGITLDITDRKNAEEEIKKSNETTEKILENMPFGVLVVDKNKRIRRINKTALNVSGFKKSEIMGKLVSSLLRNPSEVILDDVRVSCSISCPLISDISETIVSSGTFLFTKNKQMIPILMTVIPVTLNLENVLLVAFVDIAEQEFLKNEAINANKAKSEFLANMSHEIRTPMNGVIGMTDLLLSTDINAEQQEYLDIIKSSADSLLYIINDILDFSKIEADQLILEKIDFNLRTILESSIDSLAVKAHSKGLEIGSFIESDVPIHLIADPSRIRQVIVNILGNAVKFTNEGEIFIHCSLVEIANNTAKIEFKIKDTGIGISKDKFKTIFESFKQEDGTTTRKYGGTGLGLAISKKLVELMGGEIRVESVVGEGSTFIFNLMFNIQHKIPTPTKDLTPLDLTCIRVLIVDDNANNRMIFKDYVTSWGMKCKDVECGFEALKQIEKSCIEKEPFHIVLLDMSMPGIDGLEVAKRIKEFNFNNTPKIIMLTSLGHKEDREIYEEVGICEYLLKPIKRKELFSVITRVFSRIDTKKLLEIAQQQDNQEIIVKNLAPETKFLRKKILLVEDNFVNQKLAVTLLSKNGHDVTVVDNGQKALDILEKEKFDLILMDVQMPILDGLSATIAIREKEKLTGEHITIIAMTAHAMKGDKEKCLSAGMDDYISKPIKIKEVLNKISNCNCDTLNKLPNSNYSSANLTTSLYKFDINIVLDHFAGDMGLLKQIFGIFVDDYQNQLLDIEKAISENDSELLMRSAHSLKGSISNFQVLQLTDIAYELEIMGIKNKLGMAEKVLTKFKILVNKFIEIMKINFENE